MASADKFVHAVHMVETMVMSGASPAQKLTYAKEGMANVIAEIEALRK